MRLGIFLRKLREQHSMTQQEVAGKAALSLAGVSRVERLAETLDDVHPGTLTQLAKAYGLGSRDQLVQQFKSAGNQRAGKGSSGGRGVPVVGEVVGGPVAETFDPRHV